MRDFRETISDALHAGSCLLLVLSRSTEKAQGKLTVRPVELRGERRYQFTSRRGAGEFHENLSVDDAIARIDGLLGRPYADCHLFTPDADYSARIRPDGTFHVKRRPASKPAVPVAHDRRKSRLIPDDEPCDFLVELGVMTSAGKVRASRTGKFRQINRFLELVDDAIEHLPAEREWYVVDFGSGKSYLTFALHHLFERIHRRSARIVGLDRNADVVRKCTRLADRLGLDGLEFRVGDISDFEPGRHVDLAICLHACDTATDDAIAKAVAWQSEVILAVPCCQHELAGKLQSADLRPITEHGILKDRLAAVATDALRALALEICGYKTQVVEFIDMEHTAKNVLIRAVRRQSPPGAEAAVLAYRRLKQALGLERVHLEDALGGEFIARVRP